MQVLLHLQKTIQVRDDHLHAITLYHLFLFLPLDMLFMLYLINCGKINHLSVHAIISRWYFSSQFASLLLDKPSPVDIL